VRGDIDDLLFDATDLEDLRRIVKFCLFMASSAAKEHGATEHIGLHYKRRKIEELPRPLKTSAEKVIYELES
jgi:hypothetical protein